MSAMQAALERRAELIQRVLNYTDGELTASEIVDKLIADGFITDPPPRDPWLDYAPELEAELAEDPGRPKHMHAEVKDAEGATVTMPRAVYRTLRDESEALERMHTQARAFVARESEYNTADILIDEVIETDNPPTIEILWRHAKDGLFGDRRITLCDPKWLTPIALSDDPAPENLDDSARWESAKQYLSGAFGRPEHEIRLIRIEEKAGRVTLVWNFTDEDTDTRTRTPWDSATDVPDPAPTDRYTLARRQIAEERDIPAVEVRIIGIQLDEQGDGDIIIWRTHSDKTTHRTPWEPKPDKM